MIMIMILTGLRSYKGMTEQDCDILYVVLSAGQRACKDRAVPRLSSIRDRAKKPIHALAHL